MKSALTYLFIIEFPYAIVSSFPWIFKNRRCEEQKTPKDIKTKLQVQNGFTFQRLSFFSFDLDPSFESRESRIQIASRLEFWLALWLRMLTAQLELAAGSRILRRLWPLKKYKIHELKESKTWLLNENPVA